MNLSNILLDADAISTNAQALLTDLGDNLSDIKKYAYLKQLTKAAEAALADLATNIIDAHQSVVTEAAGAGKKGKEFIEEGLCFNLIQHYDYNWAGNDISELYTKDDGTVATRNKYANLLTEKKKAEDGKKVITKKIDACKAEIEYAHPGMVKTNITYVLAYRGREDEAKKEDDIVDDNE